MSESTLAELDCTDAVRKRAEWEAMSFTLVGEGNVEVRNNSYPEEEVGEHTYVVEIEEGQPVGCSCPYSEYHDGDCKHQVATAIRAPLFEAARQSENEAVATDGGTMAVEEQDTCPNGDPMCDGPEGDELPCFPCFKARRA